MSETTIHGSKGKNNTHMSIAEAAQALQCDEAYLQMLLRQGKLQLSRDASGIEAVGLDVIIELRRQCWQEIKRLVMLVLDAFEEESIDWIRDEAETCALARAPRHGKTSKPGKDQRRAKP